MQTFQITFGYGKKAVKVTDQGKDILEILTELKSKGWQTETITNIKMQ
jgi:hypothetical protein